MTTNIKKYSGEVIQQAYEILSNGELLAIPSETVYWLDAIAVINKAVNKIYKTKKRPHKNPIIVHFKNLKSISSLFFSFGLPISNLII